MPVIESAYSNEVSATPAAVVVLVNDTFTDSIAKDLVDHTPDVDAVGGGWLRGDTSQDGLRITSPDSGTTWYVHHLATGTRTQRNVIETGQADVDASVDISLEEPLNTSQYPHVVFRWLDWSNYWRLYFDSANLELRLQEITAGAGTIRGSWSRGSALTADTWYNMRALASADSMTCYFDGTERISVTGMTAHQTETSVGLIITRSSDNNWAPIMDNLNVETP